MIESEVNGMAGGRPLKFQSVEELQKKIDEYFESCDNRTRPYVTKDGDVIQVPDPRPYTISGLALALDTTRRTLLDYEQRDDEFSHTIRKAKARIESFVEESLWTPKIAAGVMFNLKNNFGWVDKQEVDQNAKVDATLKVQLEGDLDEWGS
jgi:hypothetical protein